MSCAWTRDSEMSKKDGAVVFGLFSSSVGGQVMTVVWSMESRRIVSSENFSHACGVRTSLSVKTFVIPVGIIHIVVVLAVVEDDVLVDQGDSPTRSL